MIRRRPLHRFARSLLLAALLCVLVARVAVPGGWMPVAAADGRVTLAPCSGMGAMAMDGHAGHRGKPSDSSAEHPCVGAGVAVALESYAPSLDIAPPLAPASITPAPLPVAIGQGLAAPPPPATGPPAQV